MTAVLGAIADDFTGATDLAGLLARSGVQVSLRLGIPATPAGEAAPIEIIALKCRTAPVADAVAETRRALAWLRAAGAKRLYWKYCSTFDSTPQGNIGPVAEALMDDLGANQTVYCPAFPENGRTVFMGNLFVGEQPLAESSMKDHPLTPMTDSNLMRVLAPQVTRPVGLINRLAVAGGAGSIRERLGQLSDAGTAHVIVDAVAHEDLVAIAEACSDMVLMTGGSALAMPMPELLMQQGLLDRSATTPRRRQLSRGTLVLSGSCSAMTNRQVAAYLASGRPGLRLNPIELATAGIAGVLDWLAEQDPESAPMVYATADPDSVRNAQAQLGVARAGTVVEDALAGCAVAARDRGVQRFVVAGGETSGAVAKALAIARLDVGDEIAPGVPWCFAESAGETLAIAMKSGNFGGETFFAEALERLDR